MAISCLTIKFETEPEVEYFVVGTAIELPEEQANLYHNVLPYPNRLRILLQEPKEGRLVVLAVHNNTLQHVAELTVPGAVPFTAIICSVFAECSVRTCVTLRNHS